MSLLKNNLQIWLAANSHTNAKALSVKAGLGATAVRDIIAGHSRSPRHDTLHKLSGAMGVTTGWLTSGPHERVPSPAMLFKSATGMNEAVFKDVLTITLQFIEEHDLKASPGNVTEIVFAVYELLESDDSPLQSPVTIKDLEPYTPFINRIIAR